MRNCPRCGTAVDADEAFCNGCGQPNPFFVNRDELRSGLEVDTEARTRWTPENAPRPYFAGGVITDLPRDPLARVPPWRREIGVIAWEAALVFATWILLAGGSDRFVRGAIAAATFASVAFFGARVFFFLRDGGWLPGARELAKVSPLRGALAPITWPIGALTFPLAALAAAHEAAFAIAPWLFGRVAITGLLLATAGLAALLATR